MTGSSTNNSRVAPEDQTLHVLDIVPGTTVDGPGLRTSVYLAGCSHHCAGCHNPDSWHPGGGKKLTVTQIMQVIDENGFNVTLTGGDPLYNPPAVLPLIKAIKANGYNIWLYTGYNFEEIPALEHGLDILQCVDVVVDGKFEMALRDISLHFRGSSNQRLVDVQRSIKEGRTIEFTPL